MYCFCHCFFLNSNILISAVHHLAGRKKEVSASVKQYQVLHSQHSQHAELEEKLNATERENTALLTQLARAPSQETHLWTNHLFRQIRSLGHDGTSNSLQILDSVFFLPGKASSETKNCSIFSNILDNSICESEDRWLLSYVLHTHYFSDLFDYRTLTKNGVAGLVIEVAYHLLENESHSKHYCYDKLSWTDGFKK